MHKNYLVIFGTVIILFGFDILCCTPGRIVVFAAYSFVCSYTHKILFVAYKFLDCLGGWLIAFYGVSLFACCEFCVSCKLNLISACLRSLLFPGNFYLLFSRFCEFAERCALRQNCVFEISAAGVFAFKSNFDIVRAD
ncbi:MAG: hypothetical protein IJ235_03540 [Eubacterium sp.]|nr:hypothetical protein [Eubacterium sp.]